MRLDSDRVSRDRAIKVKEAMQHTWSGYEKYAFGSDELQPRSKRSKEAWGGMGVTLVDSLGGYNSSTSFFFSFFLFYNKNRPDLFLSCCVETLV